ncbi:PRTRC system ThiF family protein (plasmid) [Xanthomonas citri pv. citri]|uniref:PRTRC system ThiF family protein n=1 Tax=Xanthomonas citri TaxID=346 RepID=UPI00193406FA|nr:PRTRC system ThiF family protein [Xanthomonas citri]QRD62729.1 PRTRC system ThiF family protein [Xanthomonas citri pv. citri]QRD67056.1 PRTRC system ThiF family protein [Xanthomonas citri pv. citri]QRD71691.1 PRTRC system ThiF family protein [Xanthomonas citri pv. citri]
MNFFQLPEHWLDSPIRTYVYGAGGTGSQVIDQLASLDACMRQLGHPGFAVTLFDPDRVSRSNIGRQRFTHEDVGQYKSLLLAHRINAFYKFNWRYEACKGELQPAMADLVLTCTDLASFRAEFADANRKRTSNTLWLDFGNGDTTAQCILGHLGGAVQDRLPHVADLYPELATMQRVDAEQPSCSTEEALRRQPWPINREIAMKGVGMLWTLLREGRLDYHGVQMSMKPLSLTTMPIDPTTWAFYGYAPTRQRRK